MNTLCQIAWGSHLDLLRITGPKNQAWCERHGWRYISHDSDVFECDEFSRFPLMIEASFKTEHGEIIAYLDNDAVIVGDPEIDLPAQGFDFAAGETNAGLTINAGVLFMRDSDPAVDFLIRCIERRNDYKMRDRVEQCVLDNLGPIKLQRLGQEWNLWPGACGPFTPPLKIKAWHTLPLERKLREAALVH